MPLIKSKIRDNSFDGPNITKVILIKLMFKKSESEEWYNYVHQCHGLSKLDKAIS